MNSWPTLKEWCQFGGTVALELVIVFVLAKLIATRIASARARQVIWQTTLVAMLLICGGEVSGVRNLIRIPAVPAKAAPQRAVVVTIKDGPGDLIAPPNAVPTIALPRSPAKSPPVWARPSKWPFYLWLAGLTLLLARVLLAQLISIMFRLSRALTASETDQRAQSLARKLGIKRRIILVESTRASVPFTFGIWKPVVVLPRNFFDTLTPQQQDVALAHELAHVARFDSAWRALSNAACALLWWHPFAWLTKRELDHASELVADEASLLVADGPSHLAECLVACAKQVRARQVFVSWLGMDGGGFRSALGKRVTRLLQLRIRESQSAPWYVRLVAPLFCAAFVLMMLELITGGGHGTDFSRRNSFISGARAAVVSAEKQEPRIMNDTARLRLAPEKNVGNEHFTDAERQALSGKLRQIRLREFGPVDNLPLSEVIRQLADEARKLDPEKKGVNFFLTPRATRQPEVEVFDINGVSIRIGMQLRDITLEQALRITMEAAGQPIQFTVEDYGVLITPLVSESQPLFTRFFRVDPNTLLQNLKSNQPDRNRRTNTENPANLIGALTTYLRNTGVDLTKSGKMIFYNGRIGTLSVRTTMDELDTIEHALQLLNASPQQLTLRVKIMEVSLSSSNAAWDWFVGGEVFTNTWSGKNPPNPPTVTGILTDDQFRAAVRDLEKRGGTDLLSAPEVTTISGRQAQIKVVDIRYIVTGLERDTNTSAAKAPANVVTAGATNSSGAVPIAEPFEIGPVVDITPTVLPDGQTVQLWVEPSMREFLGYDDPGAFSVTGRDGVEQPTPLPKFRMRKAAAAAVVFDGQTLAISAGTARHEERHKNPDGTFSIRYKDKALFFFITPRLVDPAGNPLHSDSEVAALHRSGTPRRTK
jgi:beta-lactamase regulating signal transducer with metallopeptidase domain